MCKVFIYYTSHKRVEIWTFSCGMRLVSTSFWDKWPESLLDRKVWRTHLDLTLEHPKATSKAKVTLSLPIAETWPLVWHLFGVTWVENEKASVQKQKTITEDEVLYNRSSSYCFVFFNLSRKYYNCVLNLGYFCLMNTWGPRCKTDAAEIQWGVLISVF